MTIASSHPVQTFTMEEAALRLEVPEGAVREWLTSFRWERRYDGQGHLLLEERDLEFLRLIKSLKDVDRSCDSIVRLIADEPAAPPVPVEEPQDDLAQIESLKAELLDLHARPARPWWKFWAKAPFPRADRP
jgi:DNA-binding transcriptional MerR regulator